METIGKILATSLKPDTAARTGQTTLPLFAQEPHRADPRPEAISGQIPQAAWKHLATSRLETLQSAPGKWPWYFFGETGTGKTHAAAVCFRHWSFGFGEFWTASEILDNFVMDRNASHRIRYSAKNCGLIVIDDVGIREPSAAKLDALTTLLNLRAGKALIVTCNHSPEKLPEIMNDDRCSSRLCGGTWFEFRGADKRITQATIFEL